MAWRAARSLLILRDQVDARFPNRSRRSDGLIGDAAHSNRSSDHNPWYGPGIVTAIDITKDVGVGFDTDPFTDQLAATRDPRIKYIIANGWILDSRPQFNPWKWVRYTGPNPHNVHVHVSVMASPSCDDTRLWNVPMLGGGSVPTPAPAPGPAPVPPNGRPTLQQGSTGNHVSDLQRKLKTSYPLYGKHLVVDGQFGAKTTVAVKEFQRRSGLTADGIVGPNTWRKLGM